VTTTTVLLTGFEPFGGEPVNPSQQVLRGLEGWSPAAGVVVKTMVLPCEFGRSRRVLDEAMLQWQPQLVIALGQAASRDAVSVERVAVNLDDARIPDNAGEQPRDRPVIVNAPAAYFSTLPVKAIVAALQGAGIAAELSMSAGTFVCNHVFYGLAHVLATRGRGVRGGFIHLPCLPEQTAALQGRAGMPLQTMEQAVRIAVTTALTTCEDAQLPGGTID
jgi:pyroglutamyl-peptidase